MELKYSFDCVVTLEPDFQEPLNRYAAAKGIDYYDVRIEFLESLHCLRFVSEVCLGHSDWVKLELNTENPHMAKARVLTFWKHFNKILEKYEV